MLRPCCGRAAAEDCEAYLRKEMTEQNQETLTEQHQTILTIAEEINACRKCPLHENRRCAVPGEGASNARVMLIAEGPGVQEDRWGRPFVGPAGYYLKDLLTLAGLTRDEVYITNMIKCRAPENRDPTPEEMAACSDYLDRQIQTINPDLIITLGRFSTGKFLPGEKITNARGRLRRRNGRNIFPIMHPAAGLHRSSNKISIEEDFQQIPGILQELRDNPPQDEPEPVPQAPPPPKPEQASLF